MRSRPLSLALAALVVAGGTARSAEIDLERLNAAAARLDGEWHGDGLVLKIDSRRDQASLDPERPFAWERFLVKQANGDAILFSIGPELYEAKLDRYELVLTSTSFRGERSLRRGEIQPPEIDSTLRGSLSTEPAVPDKDAN